MAQAPIVYSENTCLLLRANLEPRQINVHAKEDGNNLPVSVIWAKVQVEDIFMKKPKDKGTTRYIVIPRKRGGSQRITIPAGILKAKKWLKEECYIITDYGGPFITLMPYDWGKGKKENRGRHDSLL